MNQSNLHGCGLGAAGIGHEVRADELCELFVDLPVIKIKAANMGSL